MDHINSLVMSQEERDVASSEIKKGEQKETKEVPIFTRSAVKNLGFFSEEKALKLILKRLRLRRLKLIPGRREDLQKLIKEQQYYIKLYKEKVANSEAAYKCYHEAGDKIGAIMKQLDAANNARIMEKITALTQRIQIINSSKREMDQIEREIDQITSILEKREISQSENINFNPATICNIKNRRNCLRQKMPHYRRDNRLKAVNLKRGLDMYKEGKEAFNRNSAFDLTSVAEALPAESHPSKGKIDARIRMRNNMRKWKRLVTPFPYDVVKQKLLDTTTEKKAKEISD